MKKRDPLSHAQARGTRTSALFARVQWSRRDAERTKPAREALGGLFAKPRPR